MFYSVFLRGSVLAIFGVKCVTVMEGKQLDGYLGFFSPGAS